MFFVKEIRRAIMLGFLALIVAFFAEFLAGLVRSLSSAAAVELGFRIGLNNVLVWGLLC